MHRLDLAFVRAWTGDKETALAEYTRLLRTPKDISSVGRNAPTLNIHVMGSPDGVRLRIADSTPQY